ncbi:hypothetical protein QZM18_27880 [Burkholderia diffusa]|uniref:hypothetical protein n=1 Tax=Burkholderia diffusa TaxID=488732 RepID=UPI00264B0ABA|nr:hypothetical protein [Burkholderia diffusa]MDN7907908.1 hypothetical protein [Burkholderia diffusa]
MTHVKARIAPATTIGIGRVAAAGGIAILRPRRVAPAAPHAIDVAFILISICIGATMRGARRMRGRQRGPKFA